MSAALMHRRGTHISHGSHQTYKGKMQKDEIQVPEVMLQHLYARGGHSTFRQLHKHLPKVHLVWCIDQIQFQITLARLLNHNLTFKSSLKAGSQNINSCKIIRVSQRDHFCQHSQHRIMQIKLQGGKDFKL